MLTAFISLIAAFGGGVFGASIGALPAFIMTGIVAAAGGILSCAGIPEISELLVDNIAFGPFLGPHVCFAGGVAAAAYAKQIGRTENGADIATALNGLGDSLVLVVGGLFGMLGYIIAAVVNAIFSLTPFYTDNPGCTVFISAIIVRLLFGTRGLCSAPESRRLLSSGSGYQSLSCSPSPTLWPYPAFMWRSPCRDTPCSLAPTTSSSSVWQPWDSSSPNSVSHTSAGITSASSPPKLSCAAGPAVWAPVLSFRALSSGCWPASSEISKEMHGTPTWTPTSIRRQRQSLSAPS